MKVYDILEKPGIVELKNEIDIFTSKLLEGYIKELGEQFINSDEKEIFDPIWGPVAFNAGEIVILDSPLIQRLRKIKQLGLASYVYCDADYSRFAHTIGVFWLAGEMAEIIAKRLSQNSRGEDGAKFVQIVRLAALFHDSGHMYYSHVTEHYFTENEKAKKFQTIKKAIELFSKAIDDNVSLHEMISVMIVNSPAVKQLLKKCGISLDKLSLKTDDDITQTTEYISCLILGQANDAKLLPFYQIINGPIDADKCDYLSRDSHATNVPVAVDIFRLIHKLNVDKGSLPEGFPDTKLWEGNKNEEMYYPTIKSSAIEALNQLFMARSIMYNSVYYHQKVRTAETMFRRILEELDQLNIPITSDFTEIMLASDDLFGDYCYDILKKKYAKKQKKLQATTNGLKRINQRRLLKRACALDPDDIRAINTDEKTKYIFDRDIFTLPNSNAINDLEKETKKQYQTICTKLSVNDQCERSFFIMAFPKVKLSDSIPNIIVSYGNGNTKKYSEIFQTGTWIESKESRNREHYLVTDCEYRELAFLALQKAVFTKYGVCLKNNAAICSKVDINKINERRKRLLVKGFYDDAMLLVSDIILSDFENDIDNIYTKYRTYQGKNDKLISKAGIRDFLEQFFQINICEEDLRCLLKGIVNIICEGTYINRSSFVDAIKKIFQQIIKTTGKIFVCPLGGLSDSGIHLSYYLNDIDKSKIDLSIQSSLQEAIKNSSKGDTIVLFDDGAYSGKQVRSIFEEYMDIPLKQRATKESHVSPLNTNEKEQLQERKLYIAYMCFNSQNKTTIIDEANKVGIHIMDIKYMYDMNEKIFKITDNCSEGNKQKALAKKYLTEIGLQILTSIKKEGKNYVEGWSQERVTKAALGYNDAQQFVITETSVPTYTITPFWLENGMYQTKCWNPLFFRTEKSNDNKGKDI